MTKEEQPEQPLSIPWQEPTGEQVVAHDEVFAGRCISALREFPFAKDWKLLAQCTSINQTWGLVWRADFHGPMKAGEADRDYRIICWNDASGNISIAFATSDQPLQR